MNTCRSVAPAAFLVGALLIGAAPRAPESSGDWPQWRGLNRDGVSPETDLLKTWPEDGPPLRWKATGLGEGFSTPSVAAGRIFLMGNRDGEEQVICLSEKNGEELWSAAVAPIRSGGNGYPGPRSTPTVDGGLVYAVGLNGDLVCLTAATGKLRWRRELVSDFGGVPGNWGYSESPLVDGDKVICTPGGREATLVALSKKTGRMIWKAAVPEADASAYASVIVATVEGQRQYVQFLAGGVVSVAAADGQFLWRYDRPANGTANCATPIFADSCVFAASGYGAGGGLVRLEREGPTTTVEEVYATRRMKNHHGGVVLVDGYLYGADDPGSLVCLEFKTGKLMWQERRPGKGSLAYADGRLYFRSESGPVLLIEPNAEQYIEHGYLKPPDKTGAPAWPYPIIANGRLYLRDQDVLWCYDVRQHE